MLFAVIAIIFFVAGCGDTNVAMVKDGILTIDKSRTVEQLLQARLNDLSWTSFQTDDKKTVVEVTGTWKDATFQKTLEQAKKSNEPMAQALLVMLKLLPMPGDRVLIQFVINADGETFEFQHGRICDSKGTLKEFSGYKADSQSAFSDGKFMNFFTEDLKNL